MDEPIQMSKADSQQRHTKYTRNHVQNRLDGSLGNICRVNKACGNNSLFKLPCFVFRHFRHPYGKSRTSVTVWQRSRRCHINTITRDIELSKTHFKSFRSLTKVKLVKLPLPSIVFSHVSNLVLYLLFFIVTT